MKLAEIPTTELKRIAAATEQAVGANSSEVRAMRRELERREQQQKKEFNANGREAARNE